MKALQSIAFTLIIAACSSSEKVYARLVSFDRRVNLREEMKLKPDGITLSAFFPRIPVGQSILFYYYECGNYASEPIPLSFPHLGNFELPLRTLDPKCKATLYATGAADAK